MKRNKAIDVMFWVIFVFYLILMSGILFLRPSSDFTGINLIPFKSILAGINVYNGIRYTLVDDQIWGNVLIFVPAGIYTMILGKKNSIPKTMLVIFLISLAVEIIQYIFKIGASDIDDIILNCLGGFIGVLIYRLLEKLFKTKEKTKNAVTIISLCIGAAVFLLVLILVLVNYV